MSEGIKHEDGGKEAASHGAFQSEEIAHRPANFPQLDQTKRSVLKSEAILLYWFSAASAFEVSPSAR
jgi:hypothetical protein